MDIRKMREDVANFDLGRLTLVGWLVSLATVAVVIGSAVVAMDLWSSAFPPPAPVNPREPPPRPPRVVALAGLVVGAGFFVGAKALLNWAGFVVMRPIREKTTDS